MGHSEDCRECCKILCYYQLFFHTLHTQFLTHTPTHSQTYTHILIHTLTIFKNVSSFTSYKKNCAHSFMNLLSQNFLWMSTLWRGISSKWSRTSEVIIGQIRPFFIFKSTFYCLISNLIEKWMLTLWINKFW